eukprot:12421471-Karenia_brevis.AAC.1
MWIYGGQVWMTLADDEADTQEQRQALVPRTAHGYPTNNTLLMGRKRRVCVGRFSRGETVCQ